MEPGFAVYPWNERDSHLSVDRGHIAAAMFDTSLCFDSAVPAPVKPVKGLTRVSLESCAVPSQILGRLEASRQGLGTWTWLWAWAS